jgi:hypothetical protein
MTRRNKRPAAHPLAKKIIDLRAGKRKATPLHDPYAYDERTAELLSMLRTMRPNGSTVEHEWVEQWITPIAEPDAYGNHWLTIPGNDAVLWSCHTDTVHKSGGSQYVGFRDGVAFVTRSTCLGADDTTGCWIMRNMIKAGVPGTYVFHRGEECGGLGSGWIAKNTPERLAGKRFAIAFDRMGYDDIITSQCGDTASDAFANSLAAALAPLDYLPADGIYTDTAEYAHLIPECSNISVGYHSQHTQNEWQDVDFAMRLLDRLVTADFSALQAVRDPAAPHAGRYRQGAYSGSTGRYGGRQDEWDDLWEQMVKERQAETGACDGNPYASHPLSMDELCRSYPEIVSDFLTSQGFRVDDLKLYGGID